MRTLTREDRNRLAIALRAVARMMADADEPAIAGNVSGVYVAVIRVLGGSLEQATELIEHLWAESDEMLKGEVS